MLLATSANAGTKLKRAGIVVENLDEWELAALRKRFHGLEEKINRCDFELWVCDFAPFSSNIGQTNLTK